MVFVLPIGVIPLITCGITSTYSKIKFVTGLKFIKMKHDFKVGSWYKSDKIHLSNEAFKVYKIDPRKDYNRVHYDKVLDNKKIRDRIDWIAHAEWEDSCYEIFPQTDINYQIY